MNLHPKALRGGVPLLLAGAMALAAPVAPAENPYSITIDKEGNMRRSDNGEIARFYGVNYTLPFAHAYRTMERLGLDHKEAIDRDVYHISRMGANAFRLHLWDVELTDSVGNLLENDHLDLLDYLISSLEKRGISVILTAQTNFGNGYPERDTDTGAYSYRYAKCSVHEDPAAIDTQRRYVEQLVRHINPYTGRSYAADRSIIALEVNNEPCHSGTSRQVKDYINAMVKAIRKGGWKKPVLYNVSHNMPVVSGYYAADIQGTTYQWYPIGLVSGHERQGNFLPYVDAYPIPFSNEKNFGKMAKVVYEFDPADMLQSYLYPAVARTFAADGSTWATQFAYDPIDMARFNTEYQTHYLNLAYTPQKAIGMKIAAKAMERTPRGESYKYPADTIFGDFTVSYRRNLAMLNTPGEYFHTNSTDVAPVSPDSLREIAGYGSSPIVEYEGRGAYLLDRITPEVWRLELLPDMLYSADPFAKPSPNRVMAHAINAPHPMRLTLPALGTDFHYQGINDGNPFGGKATEGSFTPAPGVYLLSADSLAIAAIDPTSFHGTFRLDEYTAPPVEEVPLTVIHTPTPVVRQGEPLTIEATAFGPSQPDSLVVVPADASFWNRRNRLLTMTRTSPYTYSVEVPSDMLNHKENFNYRIVAYCDGLEATFPANIPGTPLDWDAPESETYTVRLLPQSAPVPLLIPSERNLPELSTIPDAWGSARVSLRHRAPYGADALAVDFREGVDSVKGVLSTFIRPVVSAVASDPTLTTLEIVCADIPAPTEALISLVNADGITYSAPATLSTGAVVRIPLEKFTITPTLLTPAPYPVFLPREFNPEGYTAPLRLPEVEKLQIVLSAPAQIAGVSLISSE